mgnify:CR=1 FL=1
MGILQPIWNGAFVYQEPVCFSADRDGKPTGGTLLYRPDEILSVTSFDGSVFYRPEKDYILQGRRLLRTEASRIPYLERSVYGKPFTGAPEAAWFRLPGGEEYIAVVTDIYRWQVLVTYTHREPWPEFQPETCGRSLSGSMERLRAGGDFHLTFYGDSITAGWEASGCNERVVDVETLREYHASIWHAPYQPAWAELVTNALQARYPQSNILKTNRAAGGSTVRWGAEHAEELLSPSRPDLIVMGFGMNNMQESAEDCRDAILSIIHTVRRAQPDCEFVLVSPMIPNPEIAGFQNNQLPAQQAALYQIASSLEGVCVAPVHSVFQAMAARGKHYLELSGNCINHPNDFSVRIYAQTVLRTLGVL